MSTLIDNLDKIIIYIYNLIFFGLLVYALYYSFYHFIKQRLSYTKATPLEKPHYERELFYNYIYNRGSLGAVGILLASLIVKKQITLESQKRRIDIINKSSLTSPKLSDEEQNLMDLLFQNGQNIYKILLDPLRNIEPLRDFSEVINKKYEEKYKDQYIIKSSILMKSATMLAIKVPIAIIFCSILILGSLYFSEALVASFVFITMILTTSIICYYTLFKRNDTFLDFFYSILFPLSTRGLKVLKSLNAQREYIKNDGIKDEKYIEKYLPWLIIFNIRKCNYQQSTLNLISQINFFVYGYYGFRETRLQQY